MASLSIVGLSGSPTRPSRTTALMREILERLGAATGGTTRLIEFVDAAPVLFTALTPGHLVGEAKALVQAVEQADLLVVASPVYRASYSGALKHLFDLVHHLPFAGKPVILAATGGTPLHGLVTEHQLRPLFGFLNALTLPTAIYAVEADFIDYQLTSRKVIDRIERAVEEARAQLSRHADNDDPSFNSPAVAAVG
jgi:FMN reductase